MFLWIILCTDFINVYFSILRSGEFRRTIEERWEKLRKEPSIPEQTWLIPQPNRKAWGDSREFNKIYLVSQVMGYRHKINTKSDAKCMNKYLLESLESELVITKLGNMQDYLPVDAPLLDYLATEAGGSVGWKFPRLQELRKFQEKRGLNYSVLDEVKVKEIICGTSTPD